MSLINANFLETIKESEDELDFDDDSVGDSDYAVNEENSIFEDVAHDLEYSIAVQDSILEDVAPIESIENLIECVENVSSESLPAVALPRQAAKRRQV